MDKKIIEKIFERYCKYENTDETGLFLLDLPTGIGKTYQTLKYIYKAHKEFSEIDRKIIYITNLKKNLTQPLDDLKNKFFIPNAISPEEGEIEFNNNVLFINSNADFAIENLLTYENDIPCEIKENFNYKKLKRNIENYHRFKDNKDQQASFKEIIRKDNEPTFRNKVIYPYLKKKKFFERGNGIKKKVKLLKENDLWIAKIYPSALTSQYKILFLSVSKFLVRNSPIIESSYSFISRRFLKKNALIFIDEFDASKEIILNFIIKQQLKRKLDLIGIYNQIFHSITNNIFPTSFLTNSKKLQKRVTEGKVKGVVDVLENMIIETKKINEEAKNEYNLIHSIKTLNPENTNNFLFQDYRHYTILSNKKNFVFLEKDTKNKCNNIKFININDVKNKEQLYAKPNLLDIVNSLNKFLNFFNWQSLFLAENYCEYKNESKTFEEEDFTIENALHTFFNELQINDLEKRILIDLILQNGTLSLHKKEFTIAEDFYFKGFKYYEFEDSETHDTQSKIFIVSFDTTPEKILLGLAEKNKVIGVSASGTIKTNLVNYDLDFLKSNLQNNFYELSEAKTKDLKIFIDNIHNEKYKNSKIKTDFVKPVKYDKENPYQHFTDYLETIISKKSVNKVLTRLEKNKNKEKYVIERYSRIVKAFYKFTEKDDIYSFLCFLNKEPKDADSYLDKRILTRIFQKIILKNKKTKQFENRPFVIINSKNYTRELEKVKNILSNGKKIFLITTYQTLGVGQNIQYSVDKEHFEEINLPDEIDLKYFETSIEKDFDAIYLDKPRNIIVYMNGEPVDDLSFNKRLFQLEMIAQSGEIGPGELMMYVKDTFDKQYHGNYLSKKFYSGNVYNTSHHSNAITKVVIQAIGRISRTKNKSKNIYVFADAEIAKHISKFNLNKSIYLPEFIKLYQNAQTYIKAHDSEIKTESEQTILNNKIKYTNIKCSSIIHTLLHAINETEGNHKEKGINEWKKLREFVLKHPTISEKDFQQTNYQNLYIKLAIPSNKYFYGQKDDYKRISIRFDTGEEVNEKTFEKKVIPANIEASSEGARLNKLMEITEINNHFVSKNYATKFKKNPYIIAPIIFNNIYKGALGEEVGKYIFESHGFKLNEIDNNFYEVFDYWTEIEGEKYYIDFKHYSEYSRKQDETRFIEKYKLKMQKLNAKKAAVVNIYGDKKEEQFLKNSDSELQITLYRIIYLIEEKSNKIVFDKLMKK